MYEKTVTLRPDSPNFPLDPVWIMRFAAGSLLFTGIPSAITSAVLVIVLSGSDTPIVLPVTLYADGTASASIENGVTVTAGQGDYYVYGFIGLRIYGLGAGKINVTQAPTLAASGTLTPVGNQLPIFDASTNLYHLLTATQNELGEVTIAVAQEGVPSV